METKVNEIGGQYMVRVRDRTRGTWDDDKAFPTLAEAQAREAELRIEEGRVNARIEAGESEKLPAKERREVHEEAEAGVNRAAAEQAQDVAEARAEREAEFAARPAPEFRHAQPKGRTRR